MKKNVKIIGGSILAIIAAAAGFFTATAPLALEATVLTASTAKIAFTEQGCYVYDRSFTVYPQISGEILEIGVKQGDTVKKGDVLAVVSASDYEYQIKSLESTVSGYQAQISNLYAQEQENKSSFYSSRESLLGQIAEVDISLKDYKNNQQSLERQMEIQEDIILHNQNMVTLTRQDMREAREDYDDDIITQPEYNALREAHNSAQTALEASRLQLEQLKAGKTGKDSLESQRDALEAQLGIIDRRIERDGSYAMRQYYNAMIEGTRRNIENMTEKLGQAEITAPVDGVITSLPARDSNIITASGSVATICSDPVVEVFVPIREIDSVRVGDTVELIFDKRLGSESFAGTVSMIEDEAETKISALGVEERKVRALITPQMSNLHIGYSMDVKFTVLERPDAVIIPKTAVFEKDGADMAWVVTDGALSLREIGKGIETREGYAVEHGLSPGDIIVTDANNKDLREGKKVKIT